MSELTGATPTEGQDPADDGFAGAMDELAAALTAMRRGDDGPCAALLTTQDDATLFGAWGPIEHGHDPIIETWHWVAGRFGPAGENVQDVRTVHRSGDLAVTIGFERGTAQVDGGPVIEMVIRVTHVLRREPTAGGSCIAMPTSRPPTSDPPEPSPTIRSDPSSRTGWTGSPSPVGTGDDGLIARASAGRQDQQHAEQAHRDRGDRNRCGRAGPRCRERVGRPPAPAGAGGRARTDC